MKFSFRIVYTLYFCCCCCLIESSHTHFMASIRLKQYDDDRKFQNQILGVIISDFSAIPNPGSNQDPYHLAYQVSLRD